ncbi:unnamed protein product [Toxocara canis]|uniref:Uncharacterized protein n=1 Tax=Toxocara canis TaxID=6265 RepID=A0A183V9V0_TOXCA|nr:unnamed protein product [Toxocara canis]
MLACTLRTSTAPLISDSHRYLGEKSASDSDTPIVPPYCRRHSKRVDDCIYPEKNMARDLHCAMAPFMDSDATEPTLADYERNDAMQTPSNTGSPKQPCADAHRDALQTA